MDKRSASTVLGRVGGCAIAYPPYFEPNFHDNDSDAERGNDEGEFREIIFEQILSSFGEKPPFLSR